MHRTPPAPNPNAYRLLVAALATASFLQWTGASAVLPLLPLYLVHRGNSTGLIGAVMASFFAAGVAAQYLSGRLGDRIGHRPVLVLGLLGYAVASAGFLLDLSGWGYLVLRSGQGAAAGAAQVACLALVSRAVPAAYRGRAFSAVSGAELAGIATGPLLGSAVGVAHMGLLFVAAGAGAILACIPVLASRAVDVDVAPRSGHDRTTRLPRQGTAGRAVLGVLVVALISGLLTGVYEACWSLLMDSRGATSFQIGLSWTFFAVPFVVMAPISGWLADHRDRRVLVVVALLSGIFFAALYPFLPTVASLMGLGMLESVGVALVLPAAQSLLSEHVAAEQVGRAQGMFASTQTAAVAVSASVAGSLFGLGAWVPFVSSAAVSAMLLVAIPLAWRGVPGRVRRVGVTSSDLTRVS
jgi:MFS family permease